jgi:hypothetical protein
VLQIARFAIQFSRLAIQNARIPFQGDGIAIQDATALTDNGVCGPLHTFFIDSGKRESGNPDDAVS